MKESKADTGDKKGGCLGEWVAGGQRIAEGRQCIKNKCQHYTGGTEKHSSPPRPVWWADKTSEPPSHGTHKSHTAHLC